MNPRVASALQFFESLVKAMALRPDDLHVITRKTIAAVDVVIRCNAADTARLIGKRGAMADCLRVIGHAVFGQLKTQFRLDDVMDDGAEKEPFTQFRNDTKWDPTPTVDLLQTMLMQLGWMFDSIKAKEHNEWTFKIWVTVTPETAGRMRDEIVSAINAIFIVIGTRAGRRSSCGSRNVAKVEPLEGETLVFLVQSASRPHIRHRVDLMNYGGNGECGCEYFEMKCRPALEIGCKPGPRYQCQHIEQADRVAWQIVKKQIHDEWRKNRKRSV